jgi:hypothetical protein
MRNISWMTRLLSFVISFFDLSSLQQAMQFHLSPLLSIKLSYLIYHRFGKLVQYKGNTTSFLTNSNFLRLRINSRFEFLQFIFDASNFMMNITRLLSFFSCFWTSSSSRWTPAILSFGPSPDSTAAPDLIMNQNFLKRNIENHVFR